MTRQRVTAAVARQRVTGIGGVFFKSSDPEALRAWYAEHLGVPRLGTGKLPRLQLVDRESADFDYPPFAEQGE